MKKFFLSSKARADLKDIGRYTDRQWGRQQRRTYIKRLNDRFSFLADQPQRGKKREDVVGSPYSFHEGRHVIFYRAATDSVEILRILHDSMDFPRHFV
ncbi:type II toxin-antitoxin system RelE/ParE family toxin [candidate division KSB1 bacterium]|nr:type II toxin-antitoxin system RelE/ParE family toxin [candidate division KSB1 bacterium]